MQPKYFLSSFEPENAYSEREVVLIRKIRCEERDDYFIASVFPPLEGRFFGKYDDIATIIIAPRHKGVSMDNVKRWPIHVYVCVIKKKELLESTSVGSDDLEIINWGLLDKK